MSFCDLREHSKTYKVYEELNRIGTILPISHESVTRFFAAVHVIEICFVEPAGARVPFSCRIGIGSLDQRHQL